MLHSHSVTESSIEQLNTKNLHNPITKAGEETEEHDSAVEDDGDAKSSRSSVVDIESETESHASQRSVLSYRSDQFTHDLGFKKSLMDHIKTRNENSLQDSMRNPYLYQLHPVIKQTSFTQTDRRHQFQRELYPPKWLERRAVLLRLST
ncbi:hypothetical protein CDAR_460371 [Caerostris darwini]|uniref:Uncharacterized protein n=1 Tax=Caerostris darwini TaxID=1538125 RepID=A0AAV4PU49_9ARAC|nr:hypothetical protein CDAR_460371 [Caerostris darwini]